MDWEAICGRQCDARHINTVIVSLSDTLSEAPRRWVRQQLGEETPASASVTAVDSCLEAKLEDIIPEEQVIEREEVRMPEGTWTMIPLLNQRRKRKLTVVEYDASEAESEGQQLLPMVGMSCGM
ncbi:Uu.00g088350.m01.CDS01 [Anthostomella pinea]|uniref:Uu.00g088350.m01.CDS01 n=1 Tax=Anthostomella pinea TaxID=933095 RepID=A0AAI8YHN9_9PEZI|nr:Uu.00g088350.m01.CDS01 [Anthostomella pinea]